jgi:hypothetical protein
MQRYTPVVGREVVAGAGIVVPRMIAANPAAGRMLLASLLGSSSPTMQRRAA